MRKARPQLVELLLAAPLAVGCHGALVGGECLEGFEERDGRCVIADSGPGGAGGSTSTSDATTTTNANATTNATSDATATATTTDASTGTGAVACAPLAACAWGCVDLDDDPDNCGACGRYCPSGLCVEGACEGAPGGHGVYVGFDYGHGQTLMPRAILRNALSLSGRDPLRVVDVCSAAAGQVCYVTRSFVTEAANDAGKDILLTPRSLVDLVDDARTLHASDVLVVHHVLRDDVLHADAILPLEPLLTSFAASGRTVIIVGTESHTEGLSELLLRTSFLPDATQTLSPSSATVVDFFDALSAGVVSPFVQAGNAMALDLDVSQDPLVRVVASNDAGAVVVHRVFPPTP